MRGVAFQGRDFRAATVGKDGRWAVHDVGVRFDLNEDAKLLNLSDVVGSGPLDHVALSPDGRVVAVARGAALTFFNADTGKRIGDVLEDAHEDRITWLAFSPDGSVCGTLGTTSKHCRLYKAPKP